MPRIPDYTASGAFRPSDKGIAAYDTLGRRVAGQYDAAASDLAQAGRVTAQAKLGIGRWPFNIIKLQNSVLERKAARLPAESAGGVVTRGSSGSITDAQFATRRMPNLAALNEVSEGMGSLGRVTRYYGGGSGGDGDSRYGLSGYDESRTGGGTTSDRDGYSARELAIRDRNARLAELAAQKRWDQYEKNLERYNAAINDWAKQPVNGPVPTSSNPDSPYASTSEQYGGSGQPVVDQVGEYGGGSSWWPF